MKTKLLFALILVCMCRVYPAHLARASNWQMLYLIELAGATALLGRFFSTIGGGCLVLRGQDVVRDGPYCGVGSLAFFWPWGCASQRSSSEATTLISVCGVVETDALGLARSG